MKIESKSLKTLKVLLAISWWGTIVAAGLIVIMGSISVLKPDGPIDLELIGYAGSLDTETWSVATRDGQEAGVEVDGPVTLKVELPTGFWESRRHLLVLVFLAMVGAVGLVLYFLRQLRQIVWSVEAGDPFSAENAIRLRRMGILIVVGGFLKTIAVFAVSGYADSVLRPEGFNLNGHISLDFTTLTIGLSVLVLSEVFRLGTKMREEQELTI